MTLPERAADLRRRPATEFLDEFDTGIEVVIEDETSITVFNSDGDDCLGELSADEARQLGTALIQAADRIDADENT